jgi:hypothetical protein
MFRNNADPLTGRIRIAVSGDIDPAWPIGLKQARVPTSRPVPGSAVTKLLCEREIQLRLTRFFRPAPEQLGFYIACPRADER